ncbi:MAG: HAD-IIIC family phosphatase [Microcoleaceae cyanobacterium]
MSSSTPLLHPLSYKQRSMWFLNQLAPESEVYNTLFSARIVSEVDVPALQRAFQTIINRHQILRTSYTINNGEPVQEIHNYRDINFTQIDASNLNKEELKQCVTKASQYRFNLEKEAVIRVNLFTHSATESILLLIIHHIATDFWSRELILDELQLFYTIETGKSQASVPPLPEKQYTDFIDWQTELLASPKGERHWNYWQKQLARELPIINLPIDKPRPPVQTYNGAEYSLKLSQELTQQVKTLAKAEGVTPYMLLLAAFFILLSYYTKQKDIIVGSLANARTKNEFLKIVGDIANFVVMRADLSENPDFKTFLIQVRHRVMGALLHQDYPFTRLVEQRVLERDSSRSPIYQIIFNMPQGHTPGAKERIVFNLPEKKDIIIDFGGIKMEHFPLKENLAGALDLQLNIWEIDQSLVSVWQYNTDLFEAATIAKIAKHYQTLLEEIIINPEQQIESFPLFKEIEYSSTQSFSPALAIASTFTAEPIEDSLNFWLEKLNLEYDIEFAPYNQIFQQLLDKNSLFYQNERGINLILFRFEDWQNSETDLMKDFISALKSAVQRSTIPYLVCLCPPSPTTLAATNNVAIFQQMEAEITASINSMNGVYLVTYSDLNTLYPVENYYDAYGEENGHIPYTPTLFTALGTLIARNIYSIKQPPYKVIVLDCDYTLWQGVCAEDGVNEIEITSPYLALQEFIVTQQKAGMLICLCSKNNEDDVWAVFDYHHSMPLNRDHLVSWRINWQPKSDNLKSLAEELKLGLDSFILIDDNPVECAEVKSNCPQVLTVQLPQNPDKIPQCLQHIWAFDRLNITQEDRQRTARYQQNIQRQQWQEESLTFADFLAGLNLEVKIYPLQPHQIKRVSQLTQRTNQFNFTTIRRSETEIQQLCQSDKFDLHVVEVKDRFGDYGLVGVIIFQLGREALIVDTFLLSCRALGRGVEYQMLAHLGRLSKKQGLKSVNLAYIPTKKNKPALDFINKIGEKYQQQTNQGLLFSLPIEVAENVKLEVSEVKDKQKEASSIKQEDIKIKNSTFNSSILFNHIATELYDTQQILQEITAQKNRERPELEKEFVAPRTVLEQKMAKIWQQVLSLEKVGIYDNFFELGGDSIKGAIAINKLKEEIGKFEFFHIVALFDAPTIAELATYIKTHYPGAESQFIASSTFQNPEIREKFNIAQINAMAQLLKQQFPLQIPIHRTQNKKNPSAIFILSPPRSGSTLLRVILGGNPQLFAPPELYLLSFKTLAERKAAFTGRNNFMSEGTIRAIMTIKDCSVQKAQEIMEKLEGKQLTTQQFYAVMQEWISPRILVDKTPPYAFNLEILKQAEIDFENALYIHLLRHPYGTIRSLEEARLDVFASNQLQTNMPLTVREKAELIWLICHQNILEFLKTIPTHRQYRIKFEDLVNQPKITAEEICQFLNINFDPEMLQPYKEKQQRMSDGLHSVSRVLGDIKFHDHQGIEKQAADQWKQTYNIDFLADVTWQIAESFGYEPISHTITEREQGEI